ncbi:MAG: cytochrome c, partial [Actinobacteria bacterium]|nr:cytochrome c [Actinomycetota bacterium]
PQAAVAVAQATVPPGQPAVPAAVSPMARAPRTVVTPTTTTPAAVTAAPASAPTAATASATRTTTTAAVSTPAASAAPAATGAGDAASGKALAQSNGCVACHSIDGSVGAGPSWKALFGHSVELVNGQKVTADDAYLKESITNPAAKVVKGFAPGIMPAFAQLTDKQLGDLVAYIRSLR